MKNITGSFETDGNQSTRLGTNANMDSLFQKSVFNTSYGMGDHSMGDTSRFAFSSTRGIGGRFMPKKSAELLSKIKFCKNRMVEHGVQVRYKEIFQKLNAMGNPKEQTSEEHLKLYECYVNMIKEAVTNIDLEMVDKHLKEAQDWYFLKVDGTNFRNMPKGEEAV